jgi:hypothetical protein
MWQMWQIIKFNFRTKEFYGSLIKKFLTVFGGITVILKPANTYFPQFVPNSFEGIIFQLVIALFVALIWAFPKGSFSIQLFSTNNSAVTIKVGDLFDGKGHLVIGINDVFDTEIGEIIKQNSVQGQFLTNIYQGNNERLDKDIDDKITEKNILPISADLSKYKGKNKRYPIGTTIALGNGTQRYFLCAYSTMGSDLKAKSSINELWLSLNNIWKEVRLKGQGTKVSMPIVGSELARISADRNILIKLIIMSFVLHSKEEFICNELDIVIHKNDLKYINLVDIQNSLVYLSK